MPVFGGAYIDNSMMHATGQERASDLVQDSHLAGCSTSYIAASDRDEAHRWISYSFGHKTRGHGLSFR